MKPGTQAPCGGDSDTFVCSLYDELRQIARIHLSRERLDHTLQPTALVHEAYLRMTTRLNSQRTREEFLGIASRIMRQVLIDHARSRARNKRGGTQVRVTLDDELAKHNPALDVLVLDEALHQLESFDPRQARIVEMRLFTGLSVEEIAAVLNVSARTVKRDWMMARAWLQRQLRIETNPT